MRLMISPGRPITTQPRPAKSLHPALTEVLMCERIALYIGWRKGDDTVYWNWCDLTDHSHARVRDYFREALDELMDSLAKKGCHVECFAYPASCFPNTVCEPGMKSAEVHLPRTAEDPRICGKATAKTNSRALAFATIDALNQLEAHSGPAT